jgi:hypothetical protein
MRLSKSLCCRCINTVIACFLRHDEAEWDSSVVMKHQILEMPAPPNSLPINSDLSWPSCISSHRCLTRQNLSKTDKMTAERILNLSNISTFFLRSDLQFHLLTASLPCWFLDLPPAGQSLQLHHEVSRSFLPSVLM